MKKGFILLLSLIVTICLVACSNGTNQINRSEVKEQNIPNHPSESVNHTKREDLSLKVSKDEKKTSKYHD
ncbi:hypothetical protein V7075_19910 [Neobacillus drentensis]|uniref:hypothetical protein n=1 Tax=Neobacillus drentensis TaxID=220684 RepID=UPI002FFE5547